LHLIFYFFQRKNFYINLKTKNLNRENKLILSAKWFEKNYYHWHNVFKKLDIYNKKLQILEIGSFEGYSALYFLENFPYSTITCVDMWQNNEEQKEFNLSKVEINFDKNTKKYKDNLKKYKQSSDYFFKNTKDRLNHYDIIYIDGDHYYKTVFKDVTNSFAALKIGGVMILDDFIGYNFYKEYNKNPIGAIIPFINIYYKKIKILKITQQIIIQKICN
jgi:predicted O-methyltransferase YrrM